MKAKVTRSVMTSCYEEKKKKYSAELPKAYRWFYIMHYIALSFATGLIFDNNSYILQQT